LTVTTLQEFESKIDKAIALEINWSDDRDDYFTPSVEAEAALLLRHYSQEIRQILWSGPFRQTARDLAAKADDAASRLEESNGLVGGGPSPRFPGFYSGGLYCRPIW
jgi:hypothetical protein